eukprot:scaffold273532_cov39-Tisochrysis_lutea.AAC.3
MWEHSTEVRPHTDKRRSQKAAVLSCANHVSAEQLTIGCKAPSFPANADRHFAEQVQLGKRVLEHHILAPGELQKAVAHDLDAFAEMMRLVRCLAKRTTCRKINLPNRGMTIKSWKTEAGMSIAI